MEVYKNFHHRPVAHHYHQQAIQLSMFSFLFLLSFSFGAIVLDASFYVLNEPIVVCALCRMFNACSFFGPTKLTNLFSTI